MAQPRDYTRQYNFNDFQTTNPSDPLPGPQVDGELDAVKLTLDDLNANSIIHCIRCRRSPIPARGEIAIHQR